jgi:hypothetical protein
MTKYAKDKLGDIKAIHRKKHSYLAITLNFTTPGVLKIDTTHYFKKLLKEFPKKLSSKLKCPWSINLFKVDKMLAKLSLKKMKILQTFVMKGRFFSSMQGKICCLTLYFLQQQLKT